MISKNTDVNIEELKRQLKKKADRNPEKYYPTEVLKELGYTRKKCIKCGTYFWSLDEGNFCGEPACSGGYHFIGKPPTQQKMDFLEVWTYFSHLFKKIGYVPIKRYPTIARWRDDTIFVQASIYDFQPHVISGISKPPGNPLIIPQYCVRFNSISNVGITGRHNTGFVMIGQHAFLPPEEFDQGKFFTDLHYWFTHGVGIPQEELKIHEQQWAGGGNLGVSLEFFSRGLELANQVYINYEVTSTGYRELKLKVLDTGMGQDRVSWLTSGTPTIYEVSYPTVCEKLYIRTGLRPTELYVKLIPRMSVLDISETKHRDKIWEKIANELKVDIKDLKDEIAPLAALYSIADHSQTLLFTIADGLLPSNTGGGYNLRVILRRALDFIWKFGWDISLIELVEWHAQYLKPQYPELIESLPDVEKILHVEEERYRKSIEKAKKIASSFISQIKSGREIKEEKLIELYDSQGITPELLSDLAKKRGIYISIPENFYELITERHMEKERKEMKEETLPFLEEGMKIQLPPTKILYYDEEEKYEFIAKVLKIINNKYVILDQTAFYPGGGGQACDLGLINYCRVLNVRKIGNIIIHEVDEVKFGEGDLVYCKIDRERREILKKHHTATHILNSVARNVLGSWVWQSGSEITPEKARLDITHYELLSDEQVTKLEEKANEIIKKGYPVISKWLRRSEAEGKYGFRIYQGGAIPEDIIRIIEIPSIDAEACCGLHCKFTNEVGILTILNVEKIQDGIIRLTFTTGNEALKALEKKAELLEEVKKILKISDENKIQEEIKNIYNTLKEKSKALERLRSEIAKRLSEKLKDEFFTINGLKVLIKCFYDLKPEELIKISNELSNENIIFLYSLADKIYVVGKCNNKIAEKGVNMGKIVHDFCSILKGEGGGSVTFGQGTGFDKGKIEEAEKYVLEIIEGVVKCQNKK